MGSIYAFTHYAKAFNFLFQEKGVGYFPRILAIKELKVAAFHFWNLPL